MSRINVLYFDSNATSANSILGALHIITATSRGSLMSVPCTSDTVFERIKSDLIGVGYEHTCRSEKHLSYAFYICGADFPYDQILSLNPYFAKYDIQLHILAI